MSNPKRPFSYQMHITGDGSPTISMQGGEKMHSMDGALSESLYIYKPTLEAALSLEKPAFLSMGLGLGYNEMIAAGLLLSHGKKSFVIASFESQLDLRQNFQSWLQKEPCELTPIYETIANQVAEHFSLKVSEIPNFLMQARQEEQFFLQEALPPKNPWPWTFNAILYDAFSGESDPHLWSEEHLDEFLKEFAAPEFCTFSTYAATGNLKRSLVRAGFLVNKKSGFGKKRESTFAHK